jgi:hypothetical protein
VGAAQWSGSKAASEPKVARVVGGEAGLACKLQDGAVIDGNLIHAKPVPRRRNAVIKGRRAVAPEEIVNLPSTDRKPIYLP